MNATSRATHASGETKYTGGETKSDVERKAVSNVDDLPFAPATQIPDEYCCPITCDPMTDPVIVADGHSYERASIQEWFDHGKNTSPLTNLGLQHLNLTPNINLRKLIQDYWQSQQQSKGAAQYTPPQGNAIPKSLMCLSQHFHGLDLIRAPLERALGGWKPPVVVVFGQESCGKSTLLERIAMVPLFPKGADLCTRLPILISLRNVKENQKPCLHVMQRNSGLQVLW
jgi:hypothetical protein